MTLWVLKKNKTILLENTQIPGVLIGMHKGVLLSITAKSATYLSCMFYTTIRPCYFGIFSIRFWIKNSQYLFRNGSFYRTHMQGILSSEYYTYSSHWCISDPRPETRWYHLNPRAVWTVWGPNSISFPSSLSPG